MTGVVLRSSSIMACRILIGVDNTVSNRLQIAVLDVVGLCWCVLTLWYLAGLITSLSSLTLSALAMTGAGFVVMSIYN